MNDAILTVLIGMGATAMLDCWSLLRRQLLGMAIPDYALVARWMARWKYGEFIQTSMAAVAPVRGERVLGWLAHYLIGIGYALVLVALWGPAWLHQPSPGPALLVGIATVAAPFLLMQPGMGAGIAASKTPDPASARLHSLLSHAVFGIGLFASARILQFALGA